MSDKQVYGGFNRGGRGWLRRIFRLMETGKVDPTPMTTHEFSFAEIERAFRMMETKEGGIIKPLIHFDSDFDSDFDTGVDTDVDTEVDKDVDRDVDREVDTGNA